MSIESLLENIDKAAPPKLPPEIIIKRLAVNKPLRIFLQSINGMSDAAFALFVGDFHALYSIAQNDMIATQDSGIITELKKYSHFVTFIERLSGV
jgi:hypothetical protein